MRSSAAVSGGAANAPWTNSRPPGATRAGPAREQLGGDAVGRRRADEQQVDRALDARDLARPDDEHLDARGSRRGGSPRAPSGGTLPVMTTRAGGSSTRAQASKPVGLGGAEHARDATAGGVRETAGRSLHESVGRPTSHRPDGPLECAGVPLVPRRVVAALLAAAALCLPAAAAAQTSTIPEEGAGVTTTPPVPLAGGTSDAHGAPASFRTPARTRACCSSRASR